MIIRLMFAVVLSFTALPALAATAVENMSVKQLLAYHDSVKRDSTTRAYDALSRTDRDQLAAAQSALRAALTGKTAMSELDESGKAAVYAAHATVVALVAKADDGRLVCTRKKKMGTNLATRECRTVAQVREDRERTQSQLRSRAPE